MISEFLSNVTQKYNTGEATEHSYRALLEDLFAHYSADITVINEPQGNVRVGRPDLVFKRGDISIGWLEAKDIGLGIHPSELNDANKNQFERYNAAFPNLIYTNCLDFLFYKNGQLVREISIADYLMGIQPKPEQFEALENQIKDSLAERPQSITSAKYLAERMAGKAVLIKDLLKNSLIEDENLRTELGEQYTAFKTQLIEDLTIGEFSDIYAETVAYGMFAARLHDQTIEDFSREEALELLPKSNPFLRNLFSYIAGPNLDERIKGTIDELADIFQAVDLNSLFENFGKFTRRNDPFIHFYETFLSAYNPKKRKARGVWYTPEPVVNFIVRAVDEVLQNEFGLSDGLADTSKVWIDYDTGETKNGKPVMSKKQVHRVQILDPATGTGTFLAEAIKQIAPKIKDVAPGQWSTYVEQDLIPRIHGFELLMASYAMCHMKLDMMLTEMGYKPKASPPRLSVYLTNSLEEGVRPEQNLFASWFTREIREAGIIKRETPIMCIIGNPPYSGESQNNGEWIMDLMDAYKKEPGGKEKLKERNPKWINNDYMKFLRFAETMIEKNGEGILGFITSNSFLDSPTFRGARWHLLKTFDKIHILDLHGNSKKKEVSPDGTRDENVFDITEGVSIIVGVKKRRDTKEKKGQGEIYHGELWGRRSNKSEELWQGKIDGLCTNKLAPHHHYQMFYPIDNELLDLYDEGFSIQELMPVNSVGIVTARDALTIDIEKEELWKRIKDFTQMDSESLREKYSLGDDVRDWRVQWAKEDIVNNLAEENLVNIAYRPFDLRWTFYTGNSRGFHCYPRNEIMNHFLNKENLGFDVGRQGQVVGAMPWNLIWIQSKISDFNQFYRGGGLTFPLYLYPDENADQSDAFAETERKVNFDPEIHQAIIDKVTGVEGDAPDEVAIFDYIYGVLHCPAYRETYKEFLKIDFPRIPYPTSPEQFWGISAKGSQLRQLHLMQDEAIGETPHPFIGEGDSLVEKVSYADGKVHINNDQHFDAVPQIAWEFYIGGYQPAQKWLKDRKGRELSFDDIRHYQKIIKILSETDRIMQTIEMEC